MRTPRPHGRTITRRRPLRLLRIQFREMEIEMAMAMGMEMQAEMGM